MRITAQISTDAFLAAVQDNAARVQAYEHGHDGSDGLCDCVGLIIGALRLAGIKYSGTHGSNYFARYCTHGLQRIRSVNQLTPGALIYKALEPGQDKYALPARYSKSPDQRDYYHIGVVASVHPLLILHCSSGGMHQDTKLGKWSYAGWCVYVSGSMPGGSDGEEVKPMVATVTAQSGSTVKMRDKPRTDCAVYVDVPIGAQVSILGDAGSGWKHIEYRGRTGYMMSGYLTDQSTDAAGGVQDPGQAQGNVTITLPLEVARQLLDALKFAGV